MIIYTDVDNENMKGEINTINTINWYNMVTHICKEASKKMSKFVCYPSPNFFFTDEAF